MANQSDRLETLFSLEVLVEFIRIYKYDKEKSYLKPAIGVRLLDFPTLIVYPKDGNEDVFENDSDSEKENKSVCDLFLQPHVAFSEYTFQRGKSCLFKVNINSLHVHLSNTPLYVMVLDLRSEVPTFVGSSLISLTKLTDRIKADVREFGICTPAAHGERGMFAICNLMGEKIGCISLGYKLLSLGTSLIPHIQENRIYKVGYAQDECKQATNPTADVPNTKVNSSEDIRETLQPQDNGVELLQKIELEGKQTKIIVSDANAKPVCTKSTGTQTEHRKRRPNGCGHEMDQGVFGSETNFSTFCPPPLYYSRSEKKHEGPVSGTYRSLNVGMDILTTGSSSEVESHEDQREGFQKSGTYASKGDTTKDRAAERSGSAVTTLGDAFRQLPLLSALLAEISQLYIQPQEQLLPAYDDPTRLYHTAPKQIYTTPTKQEPVTQASASISLASRGSPRAKHNGCSVCSAAPLLFSNKKKAGINKQRPVCTQKETVYRRKLTYGLTTTFLLRLQQTNPKVLKEHECKEQYQKGSTGQLTSKNIKCHSQKVKSTQIASDFENGEIISSTVKLHQNTLISRETIDSPQAESAQWQIKGKQECASLQGSKCMESKSQLFTFPPHQDTSEGSLDKKVLPGHKDKKVQVFTPAQLSQHSDVNDDEESPSSFIHRRSPSANPDIYSTSFEDSVSRVSNQVHRRPNSKSNSAGPADYTDDFTSLEPSEGYSPDFLNSPEPASGSNRREVLEDRLSSDSDSELNRRAALPVPVRADASPQRALKGTHVVRRRTEPLALSPPSDESESRSNSSLSGWLRHHRQVLASSVGDERPSASFNVTESGKQLFRHSRDTPSYIATKDSESVASPDPNMTLNDVEAEVADDLGSLGFGNKYHHVSELVASKLPGYTL